MSVLAGVTKPAYWKLLTIATAILIFLYFVLLSDASIGFKNLTSSLSPIQSEHQQTNATSPHDGSGDSILADVGENKHEEYVAVCMSVKDQSLDLQEFFTHHYHHMGIRRFYVMDDGSDPPLSSFEYPIPREALTFTWQDPASRSETMQIRFYIWCLERYSDKHPWMAFIDADEFLDTPGPESLTQILETFEKNETVGALGIK